jgi:amino-acid N-acetyltransferase
MTRILSRRQWDGLRTGGASFTTGVSRRRIINIMGKGKGMAESKITIEETEDYAELVDFFVENELEFSAEDEVPTDLVKCWKAAAGGKLVGGCVLAKREGRFICDGIATDPSVRGMRIGEKLLFTMEEEAKTLGADALYLVARAPGFFVKYGFEPVPRDAAPTFFECFSCPQYGVSCHPEVMRLKLRD